MAEANVMSLWPDDFVQGGLLSDADVETIIAKFQLYDYNGTVVPAVCALHMTLRPLGGTPGDDTEQYWSCGQEADFLPSSDGTRIIAVPKEASTASALRKNSNFHRLMLSFQQAGMPKTLLGDNDISKLTGLQWHCARVATPKIADSGEPGFVAGGVVTKKKEREQTALICSKILRLPGEKAGKRAAARPAPAAQTVIVGAAEVGVLTMPTPSAAADNGMSSRAKTVLSELLMEEGGETVINQDLRLSIYRKTSELDKEQRKELFSLIDNPAWIAENGFRVEAGVLKL